MSESKFEKFLRRKGFTPVATAAIQERPDQRGTFTPGEDLTYVTDETGKTWTARGFKDLSPLGYADTTADGEAILRAMNDFGKTH